MAPRASVWNHESDKDLLLTIIAGRKLEGIDWKDIAEKMVAAGHTFTQEACRQHFQKIRRGSNAPRKEKGAASNPNTPSKRKATTSNKNTPAKSQSHGHGGEDDEEHFEESPSKRSKLKKEQTMNGRAPVFKIEEKHTMVEDGYGGYELSQDVVDLENDDLYNQDY